MHFATGLCTGPQFTRYLGQADTAAEYILTDTLGRTSAKYPARALNTTTWAWLARNEGNIEKYLLSRGYILGVDGHDRCAH